MLEPVYPRYTAAERIVMAIYAVLSWPVEKIYILFERYRGKFIRSGLADFGDFKKRG
jgi:hypothetical protein